MKRLTHFLLLLASFQGIAQRPVVGTVSSSIRISGGTPSEELVVSAGSFGTPLHNFTGGVGLGFTASANATITELGRWVLSGNTESHVVKLYNNSGVEIATATVNTSGAPADAFKYAACTPVGITAGEFYWIVSFETNGGDYWYDAGMTLTMSALNASTVFAVYNDGTNHVGTSSTAYGPVSAKYHL